ncbi:MAG: hypothetical protein AB1407_07395 [Spirochaetota bacterium]
MLRRLVIIGLALVFLLPSAFADFRFEIGVNTPVYAGLASLADMEQIGVGLGEGLDGVLPILNLGLMLQSDLGPLKIGFGLKAQSYYLLATIAYPVIQASLELGPLIAEASAGGYFYGLLVFGDELGGVTNYPIYLGDLSLWLGLGKKNTFRIGAGAVGAFGPDLDIGLTPFIAYAGLKVVLD